MDIFQVRNPDLQLELLINAAVWPKLALGCGHKMYTIVQRASKHCRDLRKGKVNSFNAEDYSHTWLAT